MLAQPTGLPRRFFRMLVVRRILRIFRMPWQFPARRVKQGVMLKSIGGTNGK